MLLLAGLGNPGSKYQKTRHNIGFMFLDYLAEEAGLSFKESKWQADLGKISLNGDQAFLAKPQTFMNLSGKSVKGISSYYKISPENIIVIHDDMDLDAGRVKMVYNRGPGGHNGIKSIIEFLGTKEFTRIRLGIGRPPEKISASSFVLSTFKDDEIESIYKTFAEILQAIKIFSSDGIAESMKFMNTI